MQTQPAPSWARAGMVALVFLTIILLAGGGAIGLLPHQHRYFGSVLSGVAWGFVLWAARSTLSNGNFRRPIVLAYPLLVAALVAMSYLLLTDLALCSVAMLTLLLTIAALGRLSRERRG